MRLIKITKHPTLELYCSLKCVVANIAVGFKLLKIHYIPTMEFFYSCHLCLSSSSAFESWPMELHEIGYLRPKYDGAAGGKHAESGAARKLRTHNRNHDEPKFNIDAVKSWKSK